MGKPGNTGIRRIYRALIFSLQGFGHAWKHEAAFRQELVLFAVMIPTALWLGQNLIEQLLLIGSGMLVIAIELVNSAIEAAIDRHGDEHHELSGRAKDLGSAAVFVAMLMVLLVWGSIAWQRFAVAQ